MFDISKITESRHKSALSKELTPVNLNHELYSAFFTGSEGDIYFTTLDSCSCVDFAINGNSQPCKHMIRLAMEFGNIPSDGMMSDKESAILKYHLGYAKKYIKETDVGKVIDFARNLHSVVLGSNKIQIDAFSDSMDLSCATDCILFTELKSGKITINKKLKKEIENIEKCIRYRLGTEVWQRLDDSRLISILSE